MGKTENTTMSSIADLQNGQSSRKYYFAYGSNCHVSSMLSRCPAAIRIGKAVLNHHKLVFRSVADIEASDGQSVHGALWAITRDCEIALDRYEGFPHHYTKRQVSVIHDELGELDTMLYVLGRGCQEPPKADYRDTIVEGYREHGISTKQLNLALRRAERQYNEEIDGIRRSEVDSSKRWR